MVAAFAHVYYPAMDSLRDKQIEFIDSVLERFGWTATDFARRANLAPSTLSKFRSNDDEGHVLSARTMSKLEAVAAAPPALSGGGFAESEASPWIPGKSTSPLETAITALIDGNPARTPWTLAGNSLIGLGYRPGDVLIVDLNQQPVPGDIVCAQLYHRNGADTVFRAFEHPFLLAAPPAGELVRPILIDNERALVRGTVMATIRPTRM